MRQVSARPRIGANRGTQLGLLRDCLAGIADLEAGA